MIRQCVELDPITNFNVQDRNFLLNTRRIELCGNAYRFVCSGVFSTPNTTYIVIPWVASTLKARALRATDPCSLMVAAFDWLKLIPTTGSAQNLGITTGREFLLHALLQYMIPLIENGLRYNIFRSEHQILGAIRGRWDLTRDLNQGQFPTTFSCNVDTCDRNHAIVSIARQFCHDLSTTAESQLVRSKAFQMESLLAQMADLQRDPLATLVDAELLASSDRRFSEWLPWLQMLKENISSKDGKPNFAAQGLTQDFEFNTASFFELAVEKILKQAGFAPRPQESGSILGGSTWMWNDRALEGDEPIVKARNRSRPDLIVDSPEFKIPVLIECKYKKLEVVTTGPEIRTSKRIGNFNRDDRNQVLSFVLSRSEDLRFDTSFIVVIYPAREVDPDTPVLCFEAQTSTQGEHETVRWGPMPPSEANLNIHFFGLDVMRALDEIRSKTDGSEIMRLRRFLLRGEKSPENQLAKSS